MPAKTFRYEQIKVSWINLSFDRLSVNDSCNAKVYLGEIIKTDFIGKRFKTLGFSLIRCRVVGLWIAVRGFTFLKDGFHGAVLNPIHHRLKLDDLMIHEGRIKVRPVQRFDIKESLSLFSQRWQNWLQVAHQDAEHINAVRADLMNVVSLTVLFDLFQALFGDVLIGLIGE